jgi:hypothetical protein
LSVLNQTTAPRTSLLFVIPLKMRRSIRGHEMYEMYRIRLRKAAGKEAKSLG